MDPTDRTTFFRVLSYNIHGCLGAGRAVDCRRIAEIIDDIDADLVALQEVDKETGSGDCRSQAETIGDWLQMKCTSFSVEAKGRHRYGLAVLSRFDFIIEEFLRLPNLYPRLRLRKRGAILTTIDTPAGALRLVNTHLSVFKLERRRQLAALLAAACPAEPPFAEPLVLCGDLNAGPVSRTYRTLAVRLADVQQIASSSRLPGATFHARSPAFRIDHIFVSPHFSVLQAEVRNTPQTAAASDHLPLIADIALK